MKKRRYRFWIVNLLKDAIRQGGFQRYDIILNIFAIEHYYGQNNFGWDWHGRYEDQSPRGSVRAKTEFKGLILSFEKGGNRTKRYPLRVSTISGLHVRNGTHRISCLLYFGFHKFWGKVYNPVRVRSHMKKRNCGRKEMLKKGFSNAEIDVMEVKRLEIYKEYGL